MSKKFFSLIHGDSLHLAQKTKVISGESISTVLDAQEVLQTVKKDAERYKMTVAAECEKVKEQGRREGFEQGYAEWTAKIADLEEEISKVRRDTESVIIPIAMKAAKKIVGRELEISQKTVVDIITTSLKAVATHKKIKIYVNKKELDLMEKHKDEIKKIFENLESLSILPQNDIKPGGCVIETEGGIINAQLDNQWLILENAFQKLIQPRKAAPREEEPKKAAEEKILPKEPSKAAAAAAPAAKKEEVKLEEELDEEDDDWDDEDEDWDDEEDENEKS